jgi:hypothetical protein
MIPDERLRFLCADYAQSEGGQIAAELLATRVVLKKLLEEIDLSPIGMPEEVLVEVRQVCEVFAHSVTDSIDVPPPCDTVDRGEK